MNRILGQIIRREVCRKEGCRTKFSEGDKKGLPNETVCWLKRMIGRVVTDIKYICGGTNCKTIPMENKAIGCIFKRKLIM